MRVATKYLVQTRAFFARHGVAEGHALAELAVFLQRAVLEALLVAQLDAAEIEHAVLHRAVDFLAEAGMGAVIAARRHVLAIGINRAVRHSPSAKVSG